MIQVTKIDTFSGHRDCVYTLERSIDNECFFSAGGDGLVVKWNLSAPDLGELIAQVGASVYAICLDTERNQLWIGQNFEGIHLIDMATKQPIKSIKLTNASIFDIKIVEQTALIGLSDGTLIVMDVPTFTVRKHIKASEKSVRSIATNVYHHEFAVGYSDFSIKVFDLNDFSLKLVIDANTKGGHTNSVFTVCYAPDNQYLLTAGRDAHLKVWEVSKSYSLKYDIAAHLFAINHINYSPDGRLFATGSMDKSIKIWDAENFRLLKVIDRARYAGHGTSVNKLFWSKFENKLLSASDDKQISIWSIER